MVILFSMQAWQRATCTKCHDGDPMRKVEVRAEDMIGLNPTNGIHCKLTDLATDYTQKHGFIN